MASPAFLQYSEEQKIRLAAAIKELETLFRVHFDLDIYLTWGTLLGVVRDHDFIAHDIDVDLAYLSKARHDFEIIEEHEVIIRVLRETGYKLQRNSKGQMHVDFRGLNEGADLPAFNLDLWTTWTREGKYYHYPDIQGELDAACVCPLKRFAFRQQSFWVPARYEEVLHWFYGDAWQTPDPAYAWYPRYSSTDVFEFLRTSAPSNVVPERPRRRPDLDVEEKDGFFYVGSPSLEEPQRLNASAMLLLELCTGEHQPSDIVLLLQDAFELPSAPEIVVLEFLAYATAVGMIE